MAACLYQQPAEVASLEPKGILYRKYFGKQDTENLMQLVVPNDLREKVVSLAHDTLLAGHRGASKTLSRIQQEFYWLTEIT